MMKETPETSEDSVCDVRIRQNSEGYRFSLDAVILYSFVNLRRPIRIADLGAGSGIVGILLAKRFPEAKILLVELQEGLFNLASGNVSLNSLDGRVDVMKADIKKLSDDSSLSSAFDLVVSNPPFRKRGAGKLSEGDEKAIARHELSISLEELVRTASKLLRNGGRFDLVYLPERLPELFKNMTACGLEPKRIRLVHSKIKTAAKIAIVEGVRGARPGLSIEPPLVVYDDDGSYSKEVLAIFKTER